MAPKGHRHDGPQKTVVHTHAERRRPDPPNFLGRNGSGRGDQTAPGGATWKIKNRANQKASRENSQPASGTGGPRSTSMLPTTDSRLSLSVDGGKLKTVSANREALSGGLPT